MKLNISRFYRHNRFSMRAPPLFSRTFNCNCTLSQTVFSTNGLIRPHFYLILCLRSSIAATGVAYAFLKWPHRENGKYSNQVNEEATLLAFIFQSNFRDSYRPNRFTMLLELRESVCRPSNWCFVPPNSYILCINRPVKAKNTLIGKKLSLTSAQA